MAEVAVPPPLEVLAPGGRDAYVDYSGGPTGPEDPGHPPVNFHGFAAASGARFHRDLATVPPEARWVLVLLPRRLHRAFHAVNVLRRRGVRTLVTFKECGTHQIRRQIRRPLAAFWLRRVLLRTHGVVCTSPAAEAFFADRDDTPAVVSLATPYPLDVPGWTEDRPVGARRGIFVGTRDWDAPSRRHAEAVALALRAASRAECSVTAVNVDGERGRRRLAAMGDSRRLRVVDGPLPYAAYREEMAGHRLVLQRDASGVPGQVAGDALLCGMPCLGGNGKIDRLAFPGLPGSTSSDDDVLAVSLELLQDERKWTEIVAAAKARGREELSFGAFRRVWRALAERLDAP